MPVSNHYASWISEEMVAMTLRPDMTWLEQISAVEALSECNLAGRPINYLIELTGKICFCGGPQEENLAEIFLQFIPARTSIALLRPAGQPPGDCEAEFHVRLSAAGYRIGNFSTRHAALAWLDHYPTQCARKGLQCGPDCPEAYSDTCPAIASRQPAVSPRLDVGPSAHPNRPGKSNAV
ncbi:MAG: hypothetical protein CMF75_11340 [Maricaulis sp.]|nr:hypothetical protein [Maricaulis sp.]